MQQVGGLGIRKPPGMCTIELDGKLHRVCTHESRHAEAKQMHEDTHALTEQMKTQGFKPQLEWAMREGTDEELQARLNGHCEKLTIALALKHVPADQPIRFVKNLRVCGDCHEWLNFLSGMLKRQLIIRDGNVYHTHKDGGCSCNGYY